MSKKSVGCTKPTANVVNKTLTKELKQINKESIMINARVGSKAPDFEAPAYHKGNFTTVKLSDYLGKWVIVCFYPGDFTFV